MEGMRQERVMIHNRHSPARSVLSDEKSKSAEKNYPFLKLTKTKEGKCDFCFIYRYSTVGYYDLSVAYSLSNIDKPVYSQEEPSYSRCSHVCLPQ